MERRRHNISGRWALVTGADSGIGLAYSHELACSGCNLVIVSNREQQIKDTAKTLAGEYGVDVRPIYADLSEEGAAQMLYDYCEDESLNIYLLLNNAGVFSFKQLIDTSPGFINLTIDLHVRTVVLLCRFFGKKMAENGEGYILNMSSLGAWMTLPGISLYQSSKAYVRNFSKSLWYELREYGVGVTAVCPGGVDTDLYGLSPKLRKLGVNIGILMPVDKLVRKALRATFRKKRQYIPGAVNKIFIPVLKILPVSFVMFIKHKLAKYEK